VINAVSVEELERYLDLKELDERLHMFQSVSAYEGLALCLLFGLFFREYCKNFSYLQMILHTSLNCNQYQHFLKKHMQTELATRLV
jgi:hypothetical protein